MFKSSLQLGVVVACIAAVSQSFAADAPVKSDRAFYAENYTPGQMPEGETPTLCQQVDPPNPGNGGTICSFADETSSAGALKVAESFTTITNGDVIALDWEMLLLSNVGGFANCDLNTGPVENDLINIRYYLDDGNGFPGDLVAEFLDITSADAGYSRVDTGDDIAAAGGFDLFRVRYVFPTPIPIEGGLIYHTEVWSNYTFNDCFACAMTAPPGDATSFAALLPDDYTVDDINEWDLALCQDFVSGGGGQLPPTVMFERIGAPDVDTGCCQFRYNVRNRNTPGFGALTEFYVAISRGDSPGGCEDLSNITPPIGWSVSSCDDWGDDNMAIFRFTGGSLAEQATTFGQIRLSVNGPVPTNLDAENTVAAFGILGWGSQDMLEPSCAGGNVGPIGGLGEWSSSNFGLCALEPIPSFSTSGKLALTLLVVVGGAFLVLRSRKVAC